MDRGLSGEGGNGGGSKGVIRIEKREGKKGKEGRRKGGESTRSMAAPRMKTRFESAITAGAVRRK